MADATKKARKSKIWRQSSTLVRAATCANRRAEFYRRGASAAGLLFRQSNRIGKTRIKRRAFRWTRQLWATGRARSWAVKSKTRRNRNLTRVLFHVKKFWKINNSGIAANRRKAPMPTNPRPSKNGTPETGTKKNRKSTTTARSAQQRHSRQQVQKQPLIARFCFVRAITSNSIQRELISLFPQCHKRFQRSILRALLAFHSAVCSFFSPAQGRGHKAPNGVLTFTISPRL